MGTHPIFESDFDCLTEKWRYSTFIRRNDQNLDVMHSSATGPLNCTLIFLQMLRPERISFLEIQFIKRFKPFNKCLNIVQILKSRSLPILASIILKVVGQRK